MTDPATHGDQPTIDQARAIAAANHTDVIRGRYTRSVHESAGALLRSPRRDQRTLEVH